MFWGLSAEWPGTILPPVAMCPPSQFSSPFNHSPTFLWRSFTGIS